jgi:uncharacterized protein
MSKEFGRLKAILYWSDPADWEPQVDRGEAAKLAARWGWLLRRVHEERDKLLQVQPDDRALLKSPVVQHPMVFIRRIFSVCLTSLLAFGAPAAAADEVDNLNAAAGRGDIIAVQAILAKGSDVNGKDKNGATALMYASRGQASTVDEWQALDVAETLLAKGADVNAKSISGETALMLAAQSGYAYVMRTLLAHAAEPNLKAENGATALIYASGASGRIDDLAILHAVKALLANGADVNAKINGGMTALMLASQTDRIDVTRTLLAKGADVNVRADGGQTALSLAKNTGIEDVLEQAGAVPQTPNEELAAKSVIDVDKLVSEAAEFQKKIDSREFGDQGSKFLLGWKTVGDNLISAKILARDCESLRAVEKTLQPGVYNLYPSGNLSPPVATECK